MGKVDWRALTEIKVQISREEKKSFKNDRRARNNS